MNAKRISEKVLEGTIFGKPKGNRELRRERRVQEATDYLNKRPNTFEVRMADIFEPLICRSK